MAGLMKMMMDKSVAPGWFFLDRQKGLKDEDLLEKIEIEIYNEAINRNYNLDLWTDEFNKRMAQLYYNHFQKLYEISIGKRPVSDLATPDASIMDENAATATA